MTEQRVRKWPAGTERLRESVLRRGNMAAKGQGASHYSQNFSRRDNGILDLEPLRLLKMIEYRREPGNGGVFRDETS